jgi:hypothetical protein
MQIAKNYVSGTTIPVQRGLDGHADDAQSRPANVTIFLASDETAPRADGGAVPDSRDAAPEAVLRGGGAITLPNAGEDMVAIINGTSTLAMTLANPTKDMDGSCSTSSPTAKRRTPSPTRAGVGNGGSTMDVGTYNTTEQTGCALMAVNGFWVLWANGIGSSGTQVAGVVWA